MLFALITICAVLSSVNAACKSTILFSATMDEEKSIAVGETVKFTNVITNIGDGYDSATGVFTAPREGYYVFHFYGLTGYGQRINLSLYQNEIPRVMAYGYSSYHVVGGNAVGLKLKQADRVYVKCLMEVSTLHNTGERHFATFTGYLVGQ
ncbi:hypothetical protein BsWGS_03559 [Bradybaena similaris]